MKQKLMAKRGEKGFTLMEMLIVVAIIAILIAIAIPVFSGQLNKAKTATDGANLRSAKAVAVATYLTDETAAADMDGFYFNASSGAFEEATTNAYVGQGPDESGQYIQVDVTDTGATVGWVE
ncbi:MAG: prepilin-type N-terminal cleavage/methylation domain-containing protein [Actinobacteria bacterium]|nr:prepilin-type N-terminal cleavage/methylation domain-containing protein [Actinomycetota bacterium]